MHTNAGKFYQLVRNMVWKWKISNTGKMCLFKKLLHANCDIWSRKRAWPKTDISI